MFLKRNTLLFSLSLLVSDFACIGQHQNIQTPPNFVFILADDLGYSDVGYAGHKPGINTPNIDMLAREGMVFTNAYASCPVCSPTRASIMTGKYPASLDLTCHIPGVGMERYVQNVNKGQKMMDAEFIDHLPLNEITFPETLKNHGYATGFVGKWHLAGEGSLQTSDGIVNSGYHPEKHGFDVNVAGCAYGQPRSYFSPYGIGTLSDGPMEEYLTDRLGDEACRFIEQNLEHPFLLFLSTYSVHTPLQAPEETVRKYGGNTYFAMIEKLDQNVGKVVDRINELGIGNNTLIVFYSDNGGLQHNPPLRSRKGSLYEGGIRVPLVFYFPNVIKGGVKSDVPFTSADVFQTLTDFAGVTLDEKIQSGLEGISFRQHLTSGEKVSNRPLFWHFPHNRNIEKSMASAVRDGKWKLIWDYRTDSLSLFNLETDVGESTNVAGTYPGEAVRLQNRIKKWLVDTDANMPLPDPAWAEGK